jgi:signal transduction histidine kinase
VFRYFLIIVVLFLGFNRSSAQSENAYRLLSQIADAKSDTVRISLHAKLIRLYTLSSQEDAQRHVQMIATLADGVSDLRVRANVYDALCYFYLHKETADFERAMQFVKELSKLDTAHLTISQRLDYYENRGFLYNELDAYQDAQDAFNRMLLLARRTKNIAAEAAAYQGMGLVFLRAQQPKLSFGYFSKSAQLFREQRIWSGQGKSFLGLAGSALLLDSANLAQKAIWNSRAAALKAENIELQAEGWMFEGQLQLKKNDLVAARGSFEEARKLADKIKKHRLSAKASVAIASIISKDDPDKAAMLFLQAEPTLKKYRYMTEWVEACKHLSSYYKNRKPIQAVFWLERYQAAKDSMQTLDSHVMQERNKVRFATTQREKENEFLRAEKAATDYEIQRQRFYNFLLLVFLFIAVAAGLIAHYYIRQRRYQALVLEKEVRQRTNELRDANKKLVATTQTLERTNNELERFAYIASHDLKSPLRNIIAFLTLIERKLVNSTDETLSQYLGYAITNAKNMNRLIEDILEFSRLGQSQKNARKEIFDANEMLVQAINNLLPVMQGKNAVVTADMLPELVGLPSQFTQLFQNLIGNGIKYNNADIPQVTVQYTQEEERHLFVICDNGIGMEPQYHEQIFDMFRRLHRQEEYSGTGIGLAICKKIIEEAGGNIWVESEKTKGSKFYFTWPIAA